jgi:lipopolysaccharide/colanic/teichoic acid biosynthesis glycosyltransferase
MLLVILSPLMLVIAIAIMLDSRGPVIFRQERVLGDQTLDGGNPSSKTFTFLKFRSMQHNADETPHRRYVEELIKGHVSAPNGSDRLYKLHDDPRVTRVGRFLRRTSLDELPQLFNILRGEMSFVGPRPAIPYEVCQYRTWHLQRLTVTQGLTGLWQVRGRSELNFDEMVTLDLEYTRKRSLRLDIGILLSTIPAVLSACGVC